MVDRIGEKYEPEITHVMVSRFMQDNRCSKDVALAALMLNNSVEAAEKFLKVFLKEKS